MGNVFGYVRVSSVEQNEDRQMIALKLPVFLPVIFLWISSQEKTSTE